MSTLTIEHVSPHAGVQGGSVQVYGTGMDPHALQDCRLVFGSNVTRPLLATPTLLLGTIPAEVTSPTLQIMQNGQASNAVPFTVALLLADNLHPVGNPAIDAQGAVYTTISGTRGQQVPTSLFKVTAFGEAEPFASGIVNPTGLAFGPDGYLYVSSRHEGRLYQVDAQGTVSPFTEGLGIATGLAFDTQGRLYVGDRRGTVYQVGPAGEARVLAKLGPGVASYHLAFDNADRLYVSYPTPSGDDRVYRIDPSGEIHTIARGLGRAQGLAFDIEHNLYVVAYVEGRGGVVKITPAGDVQHVIAGVNLVGLAFGLEGELLLADHSALYKLALGVSGRPLL
jgi:hypothetical protein